jgi:hypothetical protein
MHRRGCGGGSPASNVAAVGPTPTIVSEPSSVTVTAAPLSYQWQRNGTNINAAVSAPYTTITADNGTKIAPRAA